MMMRQEQTTQDQAPLTRWLSEPMARAWAVWGWGPLVLVSLALRAARLQKLQVSGGAGVWVDAWRAEIGALVALGALGVWCISMPRARRGRAVALIGAQALGWAWLVWTLVGHNFMMVTGSSLTAALVAFAFTSGAGTWALVADSTPAWVFIAAAVGSLVTWALPWWRGAWAARATDATCTPTHVRRVLLGALVIGGALALAPPQRLRQPGLTRALPLHTLLTVRALIEQQQLAVRARPRSERAALTPPGSGVRPPNIVIVMLESTRAQSTTLHNPSLKTTPFLESLRAQSVVAEEAYAVVPHTSKATITISCGVEPYLEQPIIEASPGGMPARCLPKLLGEVGYQTLFMQSATEHFESSRDATRNMGYVTYMGLEDLPDHELFARANYFGREDMIMIEPARRWIEQSRGKGPLLMTFLTTAPHHDYTMSRWRYGYKEFSEDDTLNNYYNAIFTVDQFSREVVELFKREGLYDNTIFVFVGDHGEGFGEHKRHQHDNVIYQEGLRVPLLIHDGRARTRTAAHIKRRTTQLDIVPTLLGMAGFKYDPAWFRGADMTRLTQDRPIFSHCWYQGGCMSMIRGDLKYIHHFDSREDELFDLRADPEERVNVLKSHKLKAATMRRALHQWRAEALAYYEPSRKDELSRTVATSAFTTTRPLDITFHEAIRLYGYEVTPSGPVSPGDTVTLTYLYEVLKAPEDHWRLIAYTQRGDDDTPRGLYYEPGRGTHPFWRWQPGEHVRDTHTLIIPQVEPGTRALSLGMHLKTRKKGSFLPAKHLKIDTAEGDEAALVHTFTLRHAP